MTRLWLFLLLAVPCFAQNSRYDGIALGPRGPVPGASVAACTQPANTSTQPCSPLANLCSSLTDVVCTSPNPVTADSLGNYHFYFQNAQAPLTFQIYGPQVASPFILPDQIAAAGSLSGNNVWTGASSFKSINRIQFADQFSGSDASAKIQAAINALPSTGGVVDARNVSDVGGSGSTTIDAGSSDSKYVTLLLGPYTYNISQILLRPNLHVIGMGPVAGTLLQSVSTTTPMFVLGGTLSIQGVFLNGFRVYCGATNTSQIGLDVIAQANGGGLWYSSLQDVTFGGDGVHECGGGSIVLDATTNGGAPTPVNQFLTFRDVTAFRTNGGSPALFITGMNGQFSFDRCQFDGPTPHDLNKVNVLINDGTESVLPPYSIVFNNVTSQHAWGSTGVAIQLGGSDNFVCHACHFEDDNGAIKAVVGNHFGNWGDKVEGSFFATNTGIDGGNGFILSTDSNSSIAFDDNAIFGTPDAFFIGASSKYVSSKGNFNMNGAVPYGAPANYTIVEGINNDGSGFKHKRITSCSTTTTQFSSCLTTLTWTTAFADTNYTTTCTLDSPNVVAGIAYYGAKAAGSIQVATINYTNGTAVTSGSVDCIAVHD